jgi:non-homologous end joining protein Ku
MLPWLEKYECRRLLQNLPTPDLDGLALMTKIVDKRTVDLDLGTFRDSYRDRIEALISSKLKGEAAQVKEKVAKPVAKIMMEALRNGGIVEETIYRLKVTPSPQSFLDHGFGYA